MHVLVVADRGNHHVDDLLLVFHTRGDRAGLLALVFEQIHDHTAAASLGVRVIDRCARARTGVDAGRAWRFHLPGPNRVEIVLADARGAGCVEHVLLPVHYARHVTGAAVSGVSARLEADSRDCRDVGHACSDCSASSSEAKGWADNRDAGKRRVRLGRRLVGGNSGLRNCSSLTNAGQLLVTRPT
ncbi:hypothetical protein D3C75_1002320 [compost metagenome]